MLTVSFPCLSTFRGRVCSEHRGPGTWWNVLSATGRGSGLSKEVWDSSPKDPGQL